MRGAGGRLGGLVPEVPLEGGRVRHDVLHEALLEDAILPGGHEDVSCSPVPRLRRDMGQVRGLDVVSALGLESGGVSVPVRPMG